jgi:hypothetical protein
MKLSKNISVKELRCPRCGASVSSDKNVCDYCKAQYLVVQEERAVLFGECENCDTFKRLSTLKNKTDSIVGYSIEYDDATRKIKDLLEACRYCHIKNCQFFNKCQEEIAETRKNLVTKEDIARVKAKYY